LPAGTELAVGITRTELTDAVGDVDAIIYTHGGQSTPRAVDASAPGG